MNQSFWSRLNVGWSNKKTGLFGVPELEASGGFGVIKDSCLKASADLVTEACQPDRNIIEKSFLKVDEYKVDMLISMVFFIGTYSLCSYLHL